SPRARSGPPARCARGTELITAPAAAGGARRCRQGACSCAPCSHRVLVRRGGHDRDTGGQGVLGTAERRPSISMLSALGASAPESVRSRVVLSAPLAPTRAVTWPRGTSKETSRSTWRVGRVHRRGSG